MNLETRFQTRGSAVPESNDSEIDHLMDSSVNADWNGLNAVDGSGLYWFWDPTWDNLYNGMDAGRGGFQA